jgi:F0F1-type ATP synthase assembly protein I
MLDDPRGRQALPRLLAFSQIGLEMAAPALLGLFLDHWLKTSPWFVIVGALLGLVGGLTHLVMLTAPNPKKGGGPDTGRKP